MLEIKKGILSGVLNVSVVALTWPKTFRLLNCAQAKQIKKRNEKVWGPPKKKNGKTRKRETKALKARRKARSTLKSVGRGFIFGRW